MHDTVDAQFAWRLPVGFDAEQFMNELAAQVVRPSGRNSASSSGAAKKRGEANATTWAWQRPIVAYGPGDSSLDHTPNKHLPIDEYWKAVNLIEQTLAAFGRAD